MLLASGRVVAAGTGLMAAAGAADPTPSAATLALTATPPPANPVGTYDPAANGPVAEQPSPVPGVTPPPEVDPGHLQIPGLTLPAASSGSVQAAAFGSATLDPGYIQVSFHLSLTLGSDFATRLSRSIRLWAPNNLRYLPDEPAMAPSLLLESGNQLDGWVTYLLPTGLTGPAVIHVTIDSGALTELFIPVVIGDGAAQPAGVAAPTSILSQASPPPTSSPSATSAASN